MNFIKMVEREIYDWDMMNNFPPLTKEEYFRLSGSIEMNSIKRRALDRQNMIYRWFLYGSPDFKEYENVVAFKPNSGAESTNNRSQK